MFGASNAPQRGAVVLTVRDEVSSAAPRGLALCAMMDSRERSEAPTFVATTVCEERHRDWQECAVKDRMAGEALLLIGGFGADPNHRDDLRDRLEPLEADALAQIEQHAGRELDLYEADTGHGAAYSGVAAEIVEPAAGLVAAAAAMGAAARLVVWAYDQFSKTTGRRPMVSLGAAQYLALDDLRARVYATPRVVTSGDMNPDNPNRSFTGADAFFVLLAAEPDLHHYQVSAYGETRYIGDSPPKREDGQPPPSDATLDDGPVFDPFRVENRCWRRCRSQPQPRPDDGAAWGSNRERSAVERPPAQRSAA